MSYNEICSSSGMFVENRIHNFHDDVIKWNFFTRDWPFVRGIHRSPVNSPHKGQQRGALTVFFICVWTNDWVHNREAGDLRRYRGHYDVTVMRCTNTIYTHPFFQRKFNQKNTAKLRNGWLITSHSFALIQLRIHDMNALLCSYNFYFECSISPGAENLWMHRAYTNNILIYHRDKHGALFGWLSYRLMLSFKEEGMPYAYI